MSKWICSRCDNLIEIETNSIEPNRCVTCGNKKWQKGEVGEASGATRSVNELRVFKSGATRSADVDEFRFDLAPACATRREAKIWAEGAKIHGENNWKKGLPSNVCLNHLEYHLNKYKDGDRTEDHLAKISVNTAMVMFFEESSESVEEAERPGELIDGGEFDPPKDMEREAEEEALREIHEDKHKDEYGANIEKKIDKILEWIKFNGEGVKCRGGECKFDELEHSCRLGDQHICTASSIL